MVSSTQTLTKSQNSPALFAPWFDMLILGGLSLLLLPVIFYLDGLVPGYYTTATMGTILLSLAVLTNYPHLAATYYRVYGDMREVAKYKYTAILVPLLLIVPLVFSFAMPSVVAPWFFKIYFLIVSYHYAGQSYGISLIYARKSGVQFNQLTKALIAIPLFAAAFLWVVAEEVIFQRFNWLGMPLPRIGFPVELYLLILSALVMGVMGYVALNAYLWKTQRMVLPMVVQVVVISHIIWFTAGLKSSLFTAAVPTFHGIQYILITTYFQWRLLKQTSTGGEPDVQAYSHERISHKFLTRYLLIIIAVGAAINVGIPHILALSGIWTPTFAIAAVSTFVGLHHILLDGEVWKLRKPEIGETLINP